MASPSDTPKFPLEIFSEIFAFLLADGDTTSLKRCAFLDPGAARMCLDTIFDVTEEHATLKWNQYQRIRQFSGRISRSPGFAKKLTRLSLTTNVDAHSGVAISRHLGGILNVCTNVNFLELEMSPAATYFVQPSSMWALPTPTYPDNPELYVTKLDTLKLRAIQPFGFFKLIIGGLTGSNLRHLEISGHERVEDDVGSVQNLVELFKRKKGAFTGVKTLELGTNSDIFLMALEMALPDLNLFPSVDFLRVSPQSPNAVVCAFVIAQGMSSTLSTFEWLDLHRMPGAHDNIAEDIRSGAISLASLGQLRRLRLPIVARGGGTTSRYLSSDDILSILETIPANNAIEIVEFTHHFFNTEHMLHGRAWDHRNELIPYFRTEKSTVGSQVNRLFNIALANKRQFPRLRKVGMKVFAPFANERVDPDAQYKVVLRQALPNLCFQLVYNRQFRDFIKSLVLFSLAPLMERGVGVGVEVERWVPFL